MARDELEVGYELDDRRVKVESSTTEHENAKQQNPRTLNETAGSITCEGAFPVAVTTKPMNAATARERNSCWYFMINACGCEFGKILLYVRNPTKITARSHRSFRH